MAAPTFLTIHPELRDLIYTIHLTSPNPLPPSSVTRANRFSRRSGVPTFGWPWDMDARFHMDDCINYTDPTTNPVIPTSLPLLLCNRQMNAEVSSIITFLATHTKQLWSEIDCEIVDEVDLYPTWLYVPIYFNDATIPCLYATFRITGQLEPERRSEWEHGCGGPGMMVWGLMELLNRFLERGPNFIPRRAEVPPTPAVASPLPTSPSTPKSKHVAGKLKVLKNRIFKGTRSSNPVSETPLPEPSGSSSQVGAHDQPSDRIKIEKLVLNFGSEELANPENYFFGGSDRPLKLKVVRFVEQKLDFLFSGTMSTITYGRFIAKRVGSVHLLCDGEEIAKWNLAESELSCR